MSNKNVFSTLSSVRIPQVGVNMSEQEHTQSKRPPPGWVDGEFVRGPIPLSWLSAVCALRAKSSVTVALAIWFLSGLKQRKDQLKLTNAILRRFHVDRYAKWRGLAALEEAGLIRIRRCGNKNQIVTIIEQLDEAS
jgi:hypothetical protein